MLNNRLVEVKNGVIFANGTHKGQCLLEVDKCDLFVKPFRTYHSKQFVDDSKQNCDKVLESLNAAGISNCAVWHYQYAKHHLPYTPTHKERAAHQEAYLRKHNFILTDEEADEFFVSGAHTI
jgi:hypothetical protein